MPRFAATPALRGILTIFLTLTLAVPAHGDDVAVSQMGWPPKAPKHAVLAVRQALPSAPTFRVTQGSREVLSGTATPASSRWGLFFYVADISAVDAPGEYDIQIDSAAPAHFEVRPDVYASVRGIE